MIGIGTSGYSYDEWIGPFYPHGLAKGRMLDHYAGIFNALELNVTYYRVPSVRSAREMVKAAAGRLRFAIKAPGPLTHERRLGADVVAPFLQFAEPFADAGKLAAVLLQFPAAFRESAEARAFVDAARAALAPLPLVVELRHASWDSGDADDFLGERRLSRAVLDQPAVRGLSAARRVARTGPIAYYRFHGRNADAWYAQDGGRSGAARYRYRYSDEELHPWAAAIRDGNSDAESALAFFNNHPDAAAPENAATLARMLGVPLGTPPQGDLFSGTA